MRESCGLEDRVVQSVLQANDGLIDSIALRAAEVGGFDGAFDVSKSSDCVVYVVCPPVHADLHQLWRCLIWSHVLKTTKISFKYQHTTSTSNGSEIWEVLGGHGMAFCCLVQPTAKHSCKQSKACAQQVGKKQIAN